MKQIRNLKFGVWNFALLQILFLFISSEVFAQHANAIGEEPDRQMRREFFLNNLDFHSSVKPFVDADIEGRRFEYDTTTDYIVHYERSCWKNYYKKPWDTSSFYSAYNPGNIAFVIRPVYDFQFGKELKGDKSIYNLIGGMIIDADYKQKFGIQLRYAGGITKLNNNQDSIARVFEMLPGWGGPAFRRGDDGHYNLNHFSGNLIWRPSKVFNLQAGRDKHFIGDGYRSLFISDIGPAIPYLKQQTTIWKLQYTSLFLWLSNPTDTSYWGNATVRYPKKFASMHYISFNAAKWLNIGVFESVVWQGQDNNRFRGFDVNYLNPIVFFRPVEYSLGSSDNSMLGFAFKIRFNRNNQLYSQLILDEFYLKEIKNWKAGWWANKQGVQIGYKCFNFGMVENLYMQTEVNIVRPYTYTHGSVQQNYSTGGVALAHPMGANFAELIGILSYQIKGLTLTGKLVGIRYGMDDAGKNFGQNIFLSYLTRSSTDPDHPTRVDYGHQLFDGIATNIFYAEFKAAYRFNTAFPIRVEFTAGARAQNGLLIHQKSSFITAGLCLPLWKAYRDY